MAPNDEIRWPLLAASESGVNLIRRGKILSRNGMCSIVRRFWLSGRSRCSIILGHSPMKRGSPYFHHLKILSPNRFITKYLRGIGGMCVRQPRGFGE
ncbi:hypothetical protein TNCV_730291 [Trichonephila clavipes]|nr:hypothetical protein TNCV_730291 [Trichonephila clavipes]